MLKLIDQLYGLKLGATDGEIGHVKDFYFDDMTWAIRYLVADTGAWLPGRQVLLTPHAFETPAFGTCVSLAEVLKVKLSRKQIEDSPSIDTHRPVSRQYEEQYHSYYGWPTYWDSTGLLGLASLPPVVPPPTKENRPHHGHQQRDDLHLRSTKSVTGYQVQATNGAMGTVSGFMVDGKTWTILEMVVKSGRWYAGKKVHLLTKHITKINYEESAVYVDLTKAEIQNIPGGELAKAS